MWKIADIEIKSHVVLAPMAGITFLSYRDFMKPFGVGLSVSEMVSDCGLIYNNQLTLDYIKTSPSDRPCAIQLFGSDAETINKAIDVVVKENDNFDEISVIRKLLLKKYPNYYEIYENMDLKEKQKVFAYLFRKGFKYEDIDKVLRHIS